MTHLQNDLLQTPKEPQNKVVAVIDFIEENKLKIFKASDIISGWTSVLVIFFFIVIVVLAGYRISNFALSISVAVAAIAALIAYFSFINQESDKVLAIRRYRRAINLRNFNDKEKALLKALINIKCANEEINLKTLFEMDKEAKGDIFTEKKLLESICV